ncbi:hypothetical protein CK497_09450 [Vreelandella alkaliphila]|uniref:Uncharacterized protein n=1 Tax=Vreelandella alkaliphila TaxID=272774 RepID=A0ABX4HHQ6_9GAMM|nr:hypothetical protein CK497_09450 [Halomonas humidisoli]
MGPPGTLLLLPRFYASVIGVMRNPNVTRTADLTSDQHTICAGLSSVMTYEARTMPPPKNVASYAQPALIATMLNCHVIDLFSLGGQHASCSSS